MVRSVLARLSPSFGKLERYHRTAKARVNLFVYRSPEVLKQAMGESVHHYNYERYHEALGNVTPADVYYGLLAKTHWPEDIHQ